MLIAMDVPLTDVQRRLGHRKPDTTLRVYAHWLPDASTEKLVDGLDDTSPRVTQPSPTTAADADQKAKDAYAGNKKARDESWTRWKAILKKL